MLTRPAGEVRGKPKALHKLLVFPVMNRLLPGLGDAFARRGERYLAELWRLWTGEHSWDGAPGLARIIEDLIDAEPSQRLVFMKAGTGRRPGAHGEP
jgi:hypothetical protein